MGDHYSFLSFDELQQACWSAVDDNHPLSDAPWLLIDLRGNEAFDHADSARFLREMPCPVIALAGDDVDHGPVLQAADCVVEDESGLEPLLRAIRQAPIAAMTLVQLSRSIEQLPLEAALDMESLAYATLQSGPEYRCWLAEHNSEPTEPEENDAPVSMQRDGAVLTLSLNRASRRNAVSMEVRDALVEAFQLVVADHSIERVVLRGEGKCFSVGGDLEEFGRVPDAATGHLVRSLRLPGRWLARCADRVEAHVHGACIGAGVELPAFAGKVVAHERSHFQLPELAFGLIPGAGGCVSIARRVGRQRFNRLAITGKRINARTALDWGLVDEIGAW